MLGLQSTATPLASQSFHQLRLSLCSHHSLEVINLTDQANHWLGEIQARNGLLILYNLHTSSALAINEAESLLTDDLLDHLRSQAKAGRTYRHDNLSRRVGVPADEPRNAHSHLMAIGLHNHELVPVIEGQLVLGTYQALLFLELDGPRQRSLQLCFQGECAPVDA